jgi:hypothetical protein
VQKAYGNEALNRSKVFRRYSRFRDGRELIEDDERDGRPKSTRTEINSAVVAELVKNGRRNASRMIAESLNIFKTVVLRILKEDLGKRKLCARFVLHFLTSEQREDRVTSCQNRIAMADADNYFLTKLLREMRPGVLSMTPNQSERVLNGLVRHSSAGETEISNVLHQDHVDKFFRLSRRSAQRIRTRGKNVNAEFYK